MQFPSSSYNDYYVHHPVPFLSLPSSHNLIPLLILNNILFMLCALSFVSYSIDFFFLSSPRRYSLLFELIFLFFLLSLFKQKPLTTNEIHFIYHLIVSYYALMAEPSCVCLVLARFFPLAFGFPSPYLHKIYLILESSVLNVSLCFIII